MEEILNFITAWTSSSQTYDCLWLEIRNKDCLVWVVQVWEEGQCCCLLLLIFVIKFMFSSTIYHTVEIHVSDFFMGFAVLYIKKNDCFSQHLCRIRNNLLQLGGKGRKKWCSSEMSINSGSLSIKVPNIRNHSWDIKSVVLHQNILLPDGITCLSYLWMQGPSTLKMRICSNKNIVWYQYLSFSCFLFSAAFSVV